MKYLLAVVVVLVVLALNAYRDADRPGDDFGHAAVALLLMACATVSVLVYLGLALYTHTWL